MTSADAIALLILSTILIAIGVYLLHWLYRHSSKNQSFVRTGLGGEKVVMGGGALVVPIVHDITLVNMNALPVEIRRTGATSLITKNKMRVDLIAEFLVRVISSREGVSSAARTLGERTRNPGDLKEIIQGRFIDAMAAVAASMTMEEIHTNRSAYIRQVADLVESTLGTNGLELENAALTSLNQTDISVFDPSNAFDAEGLTQLTEHIEERRKLRNRIENEARIDIKLKDYEAEQRSLEIDRDLEYARIDQSRSIEIRKAEQIAEIEEKRSTSTISITQAKIKAEQEGELIRILKDTAIESERINRANEVRTLEIESQKATDLSEINSMSELESRRIANRQQIEAKRIEQERTVREAEIRSRHEISVIETTTASEVDQARLESEKAVETIRIEMARTIELLTVEKEKQIRVSNELAETERERAAIEKRFAVDSERLKKDEDIAQREIDKNQKIKLAETAAFRKVEDANIVANREIDEIRVAARRYIDQFEIEQRMEIELADKERLIAVINKSIEEAVAKTEAAQAEKALVTVEEQIGTAKAEEVANRNKKIEMIDAQTKAERDALRLTSAAEAEKEVSEHRALAEIAQANAAEVRYAKDAEGNRLLNESENLRSEASRRSAIYENLVKNLPNIIRESVKPMENIESIKILQVDGLPGLNSPSEMGGGGGDSGNMSDRVVNSAMKYRTQVAFVDGLMKEIGLPLENLGSAGGMSFRNFPPISTEKAGKDDD